MDSIFYSRLVAHPMFPKRNCGPTPLALRKHGREGRVRMIYNRREEKLWAVHAMVARKGESTNSAGRSLKR
jgi:hypothetical protein